MDRRGGDASAHGRHASSQPLEIGRSDDARNTAVVDDEHDPLALRHSIVIPNGTHNDLGDYQQYLKIVRNFLCSTSLK